MFHFFMNIHLNVLYFRSVYLTKFIHYTHNTIAIGLRVTFPTKKIYSQSLYF